MKDFLKSFFASLIAIALVIGGGGLLLLIFIAVAAQEEAVHVPSRAILVIDLAQPIQDKPGSYTAEWLLGGSLEDSKVLMLQGMLEAIREAASDDRIQAILLKGPLSQVGYSSGWASLRELRNELERFRDSGKEILAYSLAYGETDYFLASVADSIHLDPFGILELNGLASEQLFFAGTMQKYGIGVQVLRVGRYKAAVEPFTSDGLSEEAREQSAKLLEDLFGIYLEAVSEARQVPISELLQIVDQKAALQPQEALEMGLVDAVGPFEEVRRILRGKAAGEKDDFARVGISSYWDSIRAKKAGLSENQVVVLFAEGEIIDGKSDTEVGGSTLAGLLRRARLDEDVKAVVLRVNSPGGSVTASEVIQREAKLVQEGGKPLVVSMGTVAASGGYWISAYADKIFAQPNTITGSIGVFGLIPNVQRLANDFGVTVDTVKTGPYADVASLFRPRTQAEMEMLQQFVGTTYSQFLDKVAEGRSMPVEEVDGIAQGRVWSGQEALKLGLVDELGGLEEALESAAALAEIGDRYRVTYYQHEKDLGELLVEWLEGDKDTNFIRFGILESRLRQVAKQLAQLRNWNDPRGLYARLEFDWLIR